MSAIWECPECGTKEILDAPWCPHCKAERPKEDVPAETPEPPTGAPAQEAEAPQVPKTKLVKSDGKS